MVSRESIIYVDMTNNTFKVKIKNTECLLRLNALRKTVIKLVFSNMATGMIKMANREASITIKVSIESRYVFIGASHKIARTISPITKP